jgi:hypothetical protein
MIRPRQNTKTTCTNYKEFVDIMLGHAKSKLRLALPKVDLKSVGGKPFF